MEKQIKMEKIENNLWVVWEEISKQVVITLEDIEKLKGVFSNTFWKIQRQRERLEKSRDMWKAKYDALKRDIVKQHNSTKK